MTTVVFQVLSVLASLGSLAMCLMTVVFLMAGGANSTEKQVHELKMMMLGAAIVTLLGVAGAVWAFIKARYGLAAALGALPAVLCIGLLAWLFVTEY